MANKIAVFGGSFNPIHLGHIEVALCAMKECKLNKIIFLPNAVPPHKDAMSMVEAKHRYNMVCMAVSQFNNFEVSDYEMKSSKPSYTIDTMRYMQNLYNADMYFIIGADSLYTLDTWKQYKDLIKECKFIVADRTCSQGSDVLKAAHKVRLMGGDVTVLKMPPYDVTSTMIRECMAQGKEYSKYLPKDVAKYITDNNLYKSNSEDQR